MLRPSGIPLFLQLWSITGISEPGPGCHKRQETLEAREDPADEGDRLAIARVERPKEKTSERWKSKRGREHQSVAGQPASGALYGSGDASALSCGPSGERPADDNGGRAEADGHLEQISRNIFSTLANKKCRNEGNYTNTSQKSKNSMRMNCPRTRIGSAQADPQIIQVRLVIVEYNVQCVRFDC